MTFLVGGGSNFLEGGGSILAHEASVASSEGT